MVLAVAAVVVGSWSKAPPLLAARSAHAVVAAGDSVYALGGSGAGGTPLDVERFDGKRWSVATTLPGDGLNAPAAVALGGRIYLVGGFAGTTNLPVDDVRVYDPASRAWSSAAPLPAPRGGHAAVVLDAKIHVLGGGNSVSTIGGKLYAIGGRSGLSDYGDVYAYDAARDAWARGPSIPPRGAAGAVVYRGVIYLFGGESQASGKTLGDVLRLTRGAKSWRRVSALPTARSYAHAVVFHDAVFVVGAAARSARATRRREAGSSSGIS